MTVSAGRRSEGSADDRGADLATRIRERGVALGFSMVGVTAPDAHHLGFYREWLRRDLHGEMSYLARPDAVVRRGHLDGSLEGVRSVVMVAHEYYQEDSPNAASDPSRGVIARYARGADYHRVVKKKLLELARWIDASVDRRVRARAYVDTGPLLERDLARRAGLGWFGRNTMLIHPRRGSYFFLGALLLDLDLERDEPFEGDHCGSCHACLDACPTGALLGRDETGAPVIDARRCISYLTIELRGPIPEELRPLLGNRIYGCDICQEVCPWNQRFAQESAEPRYAARGPGERPSGVEPQPGEATVAPGGGAPVGRGDDGGEVAPHRPGVGTPAHPGTRGPSLVGLMAMTREEWDAFSRGSPIRRAGYAGFRRNVAVALGNWLAGVEGEPPPEAVAVLRDALENGEPLVREHAAWALGRVVAG